MLSSFLPVFNAVLTMIIPFFVGMIYFKALKPDAQFSKNISTFLFNVAYPATAFNSIINADFAIAGKSLLSCAVLGAVFFSGSYVTGYLIAKVITKEQKRRAIMSFSLLFPNFVFMAYPVITMLYGQDKLIYATAFNLFGMLLMPSFGVYIISSAASDNCAFRFSKSYIINPPTIALVIAIAVKLCDISLYAPIQNVVNLFDATTSILSMFMGGMLLAKGGILTSFKQKDNYVIAVLRLLILPAILAIICKLLGFSEEITMILLLIIAMPVASNCVMYTENFQVEPMYAAGLVFISSILSVVTCPLIVSLIKAVLF